MGTRRIWPWLLVAGAALLGVGLWYLLRSTPDCGSAAFNKRVEMRDLCEGEWSDDGQMGLPMAVVGAVLVLGAIARAAYLRRVR